MEKADILDLFQTNPDHQCKQTHLYYAVMLLRKLRENEMEYFRVLGNRPDRVEREKFIDELAGPLREVLGDGHYVPFTKNLKAIDDWLRLHVALHPLLQVRLIARAIERSYQVSFPNQLREYYHEQVDPDDPSSLLVKPGDPVPVCDSIFGVDGSPREASYGTSPRNLPRWRSPDRLATILLAPEWVSSVDLRLNFSLADDLRELERSPLRIATIHSARTADGDFDYDAEQADFWNVRPKRPEEMLSIVVDGIREASAAGARLIVLPELCARGDDQAALREAWSEAHADSKLLIAGSYHERIEDDLHWYNRCEVYGRSGAQATVVKAVPYVHNQDDQVLVERLQFLAQPRVELFCSDRITMMVFVCVDFLLDRLRDLARDLDVSLIIIPSMSAKSTVFRGLIDGHVAATQAVVVFANVLISKDELSRGYVARPGGSTWNIDQDFDDDKRAITTAAGIAICDFDAPDGSRWVTLRV